MKKLLTTKFFYLLLPIYFPVALICFFYNIPENFYLSLFSLSIAATVAYFFFIFIYPSKLNIHKSFKLLSVDEESRGIVFLLLSVILLSGPFDIWINGFKLLNPLSYAEFSGVGRYIRHISSLCWVLVPISFVCFKGGRARFFLVLYAIVFPILIIDRNRLFMAFYSLIFCLTLRAPLTACEQPLKRGHRLTVPVVLGVTVIVFSLLGLYRSGDAFVVESSGHDLLPGYLPLKEGFYLLSPLFQQIVLYVTVPTFNFATITFSDFINHDFLLSQLSPFDRDSYDAYPYAPVMVERFNVGTEFYPWLLYGGMSLAVCSLFFLVVSFFLVSKLFEKRSNIFTLLIFLRVSYTLLFMGFAPQFYILLNFVFVFLMFALWRVSVILRFAKAAS